MSSFGAGTTRAASDTGGGIGGGLFGKLSERFDGATASAGKLMYAVWALVLGIFIAVILLVVDYFVPFLPFNPVSGPSAMARAGKTFWTTSQADTENLIVPASLSPTTLASQYAVSVQLAISDSRVPSPGKFRHILHRGSNPVGLSGTTAGSTGHASIQPSDLPQPGEPTYTAQGLPQVMNPGIFLDTYKNDIHVFVHTQGKEVSPTANSRIPGIKPEINVLWLESLTIQDLPINTPITIGVVCTGKSLEVYVNCRLYSTMLLRGTPYLPAADNQWFGRYGAYPFLGLIKNLTLWPTTLGSSDYIAMCRQGGNLGDLPQSCASSAASLPPAPAS